MPRATRDDLDDALAAAERGFRLGSYGPAKHAEIILKATQIIRGRVEEMAMATRLEQGKAIAQSRLEILRAARSSSGMRKKASMSMAASSRASPGCVIRYFAGRSGSSPRSRPELSQISPARKVGGARQS